MCDAMCDVASVVETNVLQNNQAKGVVEALMAVACEQIKNSENFELAGMLIMTIKKKPTCC